MASFDAHKNFAYSTVATAPSPASSGTSLVVQSGDGAKFPTAPFNATVWPAGVQPTSDVAEVVRVTAKSTDTLTITRAQESSTARSITAGDQIAATITSKSLTDIEGVIGATLLFSSTLGSAAASIDTGANGIPSGYKDLYIIVNVRSAEAVVESTAQMTFNNDSGANYNEQDIRVINTTVSAALTLGNTFMTLRALGASAPAAAATQHALQVANYTGTTFYKNVSGGYVSISGTAATCRTGNKSSQWASTAAITRVALAGPGANNLAAGTSMSIYGMN